MKAEVSILDYGIGNVSAYLNIYEKMGISATACNSMQLLRQAERVILPGVGSFDNAMRLLNESGLRDELENMAINLKVPFLGVCVGMHMLGNQSSEGIDKGLGWINFKSTKLLQPNTKILRLPHMGWNTVNLLKPKNPLFSSMHDPRFYFLHSFGVLDKTEISIGTSVYGSKFSSIICKDNIYGVQFHPEKSHSDGMKLLKNFSKMKKC